ncbi:MAG: hypothetical protein QNK05_20960 [Myxococcota bacterium]|nr:hypothetical protein [Myxococcota bacterium]
MVDLLLYLLTPFTLWGLADAYICYRRARKPENDWSSSVLTYWFQKWLSVTQSKLMAEKLGFPGKDLSEIVWPETDDGKP